MPNTYPPTFLRRISLFALISLTLLFAFAACEDGTITVEQTDDGAVVRSTGQSTQQSELSEPRSSGPTEPTATPRPRIPFPPESDGAALTALFDATDGESWQNSDGRLYTEDLGQWHGVTTDAGGRVTELDLQQNQLSGEIPPQLGNLVNLEHLGLWGNRLSGSIPTELDNLVKLESLALYNNQLSGELPANLAELPALERARFWGNKLTWAERYEPGPVADMVDLVALYEATGGDSWDNNSSWLGFRPIGERHGVTTAGLNGRVTELDLSGNRLSGAIPPELGNLASLTTLSLYGNGLSREIPSELGNLTNLTHLNLRGNGLSGPIPPELGNLANLTRLNFHKNGLSGKIPASLGNLVNLTMLALSGNGLSGPIPPELGNLTNLTGLYLDMNQLSGSIPPELGNLANLTSLWLHNNQLSGAIPVELDNLIIRNLTDLQLHTNPLTGELPPKLGNTFNNNLGTWLNLQNTQLSGCFADVHKTYYRDEGRMGSFRGGIEWCVSQLTAQ